VQQARILQRIVQDGRPARVIAFPAAPAPEVRMFRARPAVRVAIASHNLRSIAHALAASRAMGGDDRDVEIQVLRGLGDDLQQALASRGLRVRTYCPVGDLVAGMAYLVRRLLENTSNESFLHEQAAGRPLE